MNKEIAEREKLAAATPGGTSTNPVVVSSAAVIEGRARSTPCPLCGGELELRRHDAGVADLRIVQLTCRLCHTPRTLYFRIDVPRAN